MWELDHKESWVSKNWCFWTVVLEKTLESPLDRKIKPVNPKGNQSWIFVGRTDTSSWSSNTLATWCEELTHLKRPRCWENWGREEKRGDRGWDGWMASSTQCTWVWGNFRRQWRTGKPGVLKLDTESDFFAEVAKLNDWTQTRTEMLHLRGGKE